MPRVILPDSLVRLFPGAERRVQLEADSVAALVILERHRRSSGS